MLEGQLLLFVPHGISARTNGTRALKHNPSYAARYFGESSTLAVDGLLIGVVLVLVRVVQTDPIFTTL